MSTTSRADFVRHLMQHYGNRPLHEVESAIKEEAIPHGITLICVVLPDSLVTADYRLDRLRILCRSENDVLIVSGFG